MEFIGILGERGSFKTCFMTSRLAADAKEGRKIVANYALYFPVQYNVVRMSADEIVRVAKDPDSDALKDATIALDELGIAADSYDFIQETPREITELVAQLRKDHALAWYTSQTFGQIAKRLRDQTDAFLLCEDLDWNVNAGPYHRLTCAGVGKITVFDKYMRQINEFFFDGKPWYDYYNTDEKQRRAPRKEKVGA